jgi:FG-GAP-like repeat
LNRDGWLDLVFPTLIDSGDMTIFWGGSDGFDSAHKTSLPSPAAISSRVADLNRDGYLDIVLPNYYDPLPKPGTQFHPHAFGGSTEGSILVYWGGPNGYAVDRREVLPSIGTADVAIADLKGDGYLDIVSTHYAASPQRRAPSYIFWNSSEGFDPDHVTRFPTFAACGVMIADFNLDGHPDIRVANHVKDGDHSAVTTFIYWGGYDSYSPAHRSELYAPGDHFFTMHDIGNVYDRTDRYDYISAPFDAGKSSRFERIDWEGETPFQTALEFQVRTASTREGLEKAAWTGPDGAASYYQHSDSALQGLPEGRWIEYKASLISPNDADTPVLRSVSISYR